MRPTRLVAEVWRNVLGRPLLSATVAVTAIVIGLVGATWAVSTTHRVEERWETQLLRGISAVRVVESHGGTLSAARCDDLNRLAGVQASGGLLREEVVTPAGRPSERIYLKHVTPGYVAFAFPAEAQALGAGVVVGRDAAVRLDLSDGAPIALDRRGNPTPDWLTIDRAATTQARVDGAGGSLVVASAPVGVIGECDVDIEPQHREAVTTVLLGWFDGDSVVVGPFLPGDDTRADPRSDLEERPTRFVGIGSGVLLAILAAAMWLVRRGELALYVVLGLELRQLLLMASAETLVLLAAPFAAGTAVALQAREADAGPALLLTFPSDLLLAAPVIVLVPWVAVLVVRTAGPLLVLREA